ncbi:hypothetical protein, partial [Achromobacter xylosoxidans]|uniref:hypothetical protein n=1 Tax=Alcaligenes xylosoxydans xylosoxydans TaxID=85698 RepID=UPI001F139DEB
MMALSRVGKVGGASADTTHLAASGTGSLIAIVRAGTPSTPRFCLWSAREVVPRNMPYAAPTTTALPP